MSEAPLTVERPAPGTLGSLRPPLLNLFLFVMTAASAFVAGALLTDTQLPPPTQAEAVRHGIAVGGKRRCIAPRLGNPGMCFFDLANDAVPNQAHRQPIMVHRLNLNAHLRDEFPAIGELG